MKCKKSTSTELKDLVRNVRTDYNFSRKQLATLIGVTPFTISKIENGNYNITLKSYKKIDDFLKNIHFDMSLEEEKFLNSDNINLIKELTTIVNLLLDKTIRIEQQLQALTEILTTSSYNEPLVHVEKNTRIISETSSCTDEANSPNFSNVLGEQLREIRKKKNLLQVQLARLSRVSRRTISEIETGKRLNPDILTLSKLSKALNIDLLELDASKISDIYPVKRSNNCLGDRIVKARLKQNINQGELAQLSGICQTTLSLIETGKTYQPCDKTLRKISSILNIDFDELKKLRECQLQALTEILSYDEPLVNTEKNTSFISETSSCTDEANSPNFSNILGKKLREIRREKNLSQVQLAKLSQTTQRDISDIETGKRLNPTISTLSKLAKALDLNLEDFIS